MNQVAMAAFVEQLLPAFRAGDPGVAAKRAEAENVRLLRDIYNAVTRQDFQAALGYLTDDIELEIIGPPELPFAGHWRGRAEVATALAKNFAHLEDQRAEVHHLVAQGDTVVVFAQERGRFVATGLPYDLHWVHLFQFRDGKVARFREICDHTGLLDSAPTAVVRQ
jgi:ketosteroid isomerase-like protein